MKKNTVVTTSYKQLQQLFLYFYDTSCFRRNNEYCKDISTYKPFDESCLKINDGSLLMTGDKFLCEYVNKTLLIFIFIYNISDFKLNNLKTNEISLIRCVYTIMWSLKGYHNFCTYIMAIF